MKQYFLTADFLVSLFACESPPQILAANGILAQADRGEATLHIDRQVVLDALSILTSKHRYSKKAVAAGFLATLSNPGVITTSKRDIVQLLEAYARGEFVAHNSRLPTGNILQDLPKRLSESDGAIGEGV